MGRVFTWDASIPEKSSFHRVATDLREALSAEPSVPFASFIGSFVSGEFNFRSDLDCVVIYETEKEESVMKVTHEVNRRAHALHVPINFTACDTLVAGTRFHHLGTAFVRHLQSSIDAGGLIKGNLANLLAPASPAEQEIESYLRVKMSGLQATLMRKASLSEEETVRFLGKALEAPIHVARKMLIYEGTLQGDSKREVAETYRERMPEPLSRQLDWLLALDKWYSGHLFLQTEKPDYEGYLDGLVRIEQGVPRVLQFLRSNILRLNDGR